MWIGVGCMEACYEGGKSGLWIGVGYWGVWRHAMRGEKQGCVDRGGVYGGML